MGTMTLLMISKMRTFLKKKKFHQRKVVVVKSILVPLTWSPRRKSNLNERGKEIVWLLPSVKRKLERIGQLELKVKDLKGENSELANVVKKLKESVYSLKREVMEHAKSGCQI